MAYLAAERASGKNWKQRFVRLLRVTRLIISFSASVALLPGLIVLGGNMTATDGIHVPVISAAEEDWRRLPDDPGGRVTDEIGFTVNSLLIGKQAAELSGEITLADPPTELYSEDISLREYAAGRPADDLGWLSVNADLALGLKRAGRSVTVADAKLASGLGQQIDPSLVEPGRVLVQVGAFRLRSSAEYEWRQLNLSLGRHLRGRDWMIQRTDTGAGDLYRLRVAGFADWDDAIVFCGRLVSRGAECSPVVAN